MLIYINNKQIKKHKKIHYIKTKQPTKNKNNNIIQIN